MDIERIKIFLDKYLEDRNLDSISPVEANHLLSEAGLLGDSPNRPGKPFRKLLRAGMIPNAMQPGGKGSAWIIHHSRKPYNVKDHREVHSNHPLNNHECENYRSYYFSNLEQLRRKYKPYEIKILFIGESPPPGDRFFYKRNSNLYIHTRKAFLKAYEDKLKPDDDFLSFFIELGCYLDDLCLSPIDKKNLKEKSSNNNEYLRLLHRVRSDCIDHLAIRISLNKPKLIICVMKEIRRYIEEAVDNSKVSPIEINYLPFPRGSQKNKDNYVNELTQLLIRLRIQREEHYF